MMRSVNNSKPKNKKTEFFSFVFTTFFNLILLQVVDMTWIISITIIITFGLLTLNYNSNFKTKIFSTILIVLIMYLSEIAVRFLVEQPQFTTNISVSETMLHMSIYCRVIELTTITFLVRLGNKNKWNNKTFIKWNINILIAFIVVFFELSIRSREITQQEIIFNFILVLYITAALAYLYITEQNIREKERSILQQQIANFHNQYDLLCTSSHMLLELYYNTKEYLAVMRSMAEAEGNEILISYIDSFMSVEIKEKDLIHTGNYTIDSILSTKFANARKLGITVEHNIFIPKNLSIDGIDITIVLSGLLNCAIEDLMYYSDKILTFQMRYEKVGMLTISMAHDNTVFDTERKKYKYVYRDDITVRGIEKVAKNYSGSFWSNIKDNRVYIKVILVIPQIEIGNIEGSY